jgi:NitT/TauT family transport system substrate-binding protein/putative hydroxymethylpyrimidine transport system substrate-binding protein
LPALAAGCGDEAAGPTTTTPAELRLALDFTPNAAHAPIYAAVRGGHDRDNGLRLRILPPGSGTPDSIKLVSSGRADVGVLDIHDLGLARERGADIVAIGALVQKPLAAVIARGGIRRPRDLAGKRAGVAGLPSDDAVLRAVVEGDGGRFADVRRITIGFAAVPSLIERKVDAVTAFWNAEGVVLRRRGVRTREFRVEDYGAPAYPEVVLFTSRRTLERRRGDMHKLITALKGGVKTALGDRNATIDEIAAASGADRPLVQAQLEAVAPLFAPPLDLDRKLLEAWARFDLRFGILTKPLDIDAAFAFDLG